MSSISNPVVNRVQRKRLRFIHTAYLVTGPKSERLKRRVSVAAGSIRQDEFFAARQQGLKAKEMLYIHSVDYKGEELLERGGVMMSIYRTYPDEETGITELYLVERKGEQ